MARSRRVGHNMAAIVVMAMTVAQQAIAFSSYARAAAPRGCSTPAGRFRWTGASGGSCATAWHCSPARATMGCSHLRLCFLARRRQPASQRCHSMHLMCASLKQQDELQARVDTSLEPVLQRIFSAEASFEGPRDLRRDLTNAGFRVLDASDAQLSSALRREYLERLLPNRPELSKLDPRLAAELGFTPGETPELFDGRAVLMMRGYSVEERSGRLLIEKLEYLQSTVVERVVDAVLKRGVAVRARVRRALQAEYLQPLKPIANVTSIAAKKAFTSRYGSGPTPPSPIEQDGQLGDGSDEVDDVLASFEKRMTLGQVFGSVTNFRTLVSTLLSQSNLSEPTYSELFVVWKPRGSAEYNLTHEVVQKLQPIANALQLSHLLPTLAPSPPPPPPLPMEMRVFTDIPIANFGAVLPYTRLVFRPADALRLDLISTVSLLAVFANLRFDKPTLGVAAAVSFSVWVARTFISYRQALLRYEAFRNQFLQQRLVARDDEAGEYLLRASCAERARVAAWAFEFLLSQQDQQAEFEELVMQAEYALARVEQSAGAAGVDASAVETAMPHKEGEEHASRAASDVIHPSPLSGVQRADLERAVGELLRLGLIQPARHESGGPSDTSAEAATGQDRLRESGTEAERFHKVGSGSSFSIVPEWQAALSAHWSGLLGLDAPR